MATSRDPLTVTCPVCASEPGVACRARHFPSLIVEHQARREAAAGQRPIRVIGDVFTAARAGRVETFECAACGQPAVLVAGERAHVEQLDNGAVTVWRDCRPSDVAKAPTLF
ncbi:hypothetical protein KDW75_gp60 [Mycobacterium phage Mercurio]|uniref:DNA-binding phage zinc finger domain-containing protein n=1 Tax=Mycobacterium phage Mercurio TaxID=2575612 RepID=A0A5J6TA42_9CAUD|nr:hypothetical protein KDW75_gp60 [Mycobacterium phage Mercurio]QFG06062.1 hypothetical protein PBI_MERCURIO_60 [Mycobacterium phage Mercurio]